jgi:hypothetical protein
MNDTDNTQDRGLTTEQIAAAGSRTSQEDVPAPTGHEGFDEAFDDDYADDDYADDGDRLTAGHAASGYADPSGYADRGVPDTAGEGSVAAAGPRPRASLLAEGELQNMTMRWKDIQAEFVDEPSSAVQQADALVAELMQRLAEMFASERAGLEQRLAGGNGVSTEDLRQGLRLYRSFFERLLAA